MVGLAVLLGIGIVAAHDKAVAGETRLLMPGPRLLNSNWAIIASLPRLMGHPRHHQKAGRLYGRSDRIVNNITMAIMNKIMMIGPVWKRG